LYRAGTLSAISEDASASNRKAMSIVGTTNEWAVQIKLDPFLDTTYSKWHVYAMARVDINPGVSQTGAGVQCGINVTSTRKGVSQMTIPLDDVDSSIYQKIDLGVQQLGGDMYLWFAPTHNPAVAKVYIDRVILIREK